MKLIIGLGNPGEKYENNRHNVGFMVVDKLSQELGLGNFELNKNLKSLILNQKSYLLAKPQTFMNSSGTAVKNLTSFYHLQAPDVWVIHDDLDIILGQYKIQKGIGPKLHYGIKSIEEELKTKDFWRVRVGVDNRSSNNRTLGEKYVLEDFEKTEIDIRDKVIVEVVEELRDKIMNYEL